jgi:hypothetical protein
VSTANDAGQPIVSDSERANEVRSALARSEDNNIVLSAAIQQCYGRYIIMIRAKPSQGQKATNPNKKYVAVALKVAIFINNSPKEAPIFQ